ncbi:MAG: sugar ABC transporter permease [Clostridia bacterium]|nr:sugar ABC transporter permease [Clostridia bacterium]
MGNITTALKKGDIITRVSFLIMGFGNLVRGQVVKGILYLAVEAVAIFYFLTSGFASISALRHLGTNEQGWVFDEEKGIDVLSTGDNSMLILLYGVLSLFILVAFIFIWSANVKDAYHVQNTVKFGKRPKTFREEIKEYTDSKLHQTLLFLPTLGIISFTVLPLVFMVLIAFTNFDRSHQPPGKLFTWIGLENFKTMLSSGSVIGKTFWPVLGWTFVWAIFATVFNYVLGMILAILINKKGIKYKPFFRTIFIMSIALPQFVSLLVMRNILDDDGALNVLLREAGIIENYIPFLTNGTMAKITILVVNLWIGIPYSMLITTGILMNIPADLYESARIDGASAITQFFRITLPYVLFVTAPYLITQFIGNINNFNIIYFLTKGGPATLDYYQAGKTDLLVTWLYKLTVNTKDYSYASTIGILVFVISAVVSLLTYRRTSSYKNEEAFS